MLQLISRVDRGKLLKIAKSPLLRADWLPHSPPDDVANRSQPSPATSAYDRVLATTLSNSVLVTKKDSTPRKFFRRPHYKYV